MKILFCRKCKDVFKITRSFKKCSCEMSEARFTGKVFEVRGSGVVLSPTNASIKKALEEFDRTGSSRAIETVIPPAKGGNIVHLSRRKKSRKK